MGPKVQRVKTGFVDKRVERGRQFEISVSASSTLVAGQEQVDIKTAKLRELWRGFNQKSGKPS